MRKYRNGKLVEMAKEEIRSLEAAQADAVVAKRNRAAPPPSDTEVLRRALEDKGMTITDADMEAAQSALKRRPTKRTAP